MLRRSLLVKTVLYQWDARSKTFLAVKDSPGGPLSSSLKWTKTEEIDFVREADYQVCQRVAAQIRLEIDFPHEPVSNDFPIMARKLCYRT